MNGSVRQKFLTGWAVWMTVLLVAGVAGTAGASETTVSDDGAVAAEATGTGSAPTMASSTDDPTDTTQIDGDVDPSLTPPPSPTGEVASADDPDRYPDIEVPTKPWSYDSQYFFGLTRGLDDEKLSDTERYASYCGTIPLDVVGLPAAALAGLFGS